MAFFGFGKKKPRRKIRRRIRRPKKRVKKRVKYKPRKIRKRVVKKVKKKVVKRRKKIIKPKKIKKVIKKPKIIKPLIEKIPDEKAYDLLKRYRIPLPPYSFCKRENDLIPALKKTGFPVVMKVSGRTLIHKTDIGGIKLNIDNEEEARKTFNQLMKIKGCEKVLIQRMIKEGYELILGAKSDKQFGKVVAIGLGGIFVEIFKDVVFRVCPISVKDAEDMVLELKGYEILKGARGKKPINFNTLHDTLVKVSRLAIAQKIKELDINPLFCNEKGCFAADVRIVK
jgi:acyl-CoA synthetase (NDP forming)